MIGAVGEAKTMTAYDVRPRDLVWCEKRGEFRTVASWRNSIEHGLVLTFEADTGPEEVPYEKNAWLLVQRPPAPEWVRPRPEGAIEVTVTETVTWCLSPEERQHWARMAEAHGMVFDSEVDAIRWAIEANMVETHKASSWTSGAGVDYSGSVEASAVAASEGES